MSDSASKAVFLSYASQDAEAARRIAEALREAGVEVWFDQDALVGGDAWDAKIRGQIGSCALFIPVISAATQERLEGYFRLEWKLAANRSHTMAEERTFLLPVVIDATRDADGKVPAEFRAVQWTKLPGGETPTGFVTRVQKLLGGPSAPVATVAPVAPVPAGAVPAAQAGLPPWVGVALGAGLLALGAFVVLRPTGRDAPPAPKPAAEAKLAPTVVPAPVAAAPTAPAVADKSIAVLPFTNMSDDKDASAFFADGIHEDILTNLAHIGELRVVSRTSVMEYRGTKENVRTIAQKLGVTYLLEGSVRRAGTKVRVTGQLIRAATDEHVWAETYTTDLTDVFTIQSELAQKIAAALQTALSPREKKLISQRPTENPAAYDLYLKAREAVRNDGGRRTALEQEKLLQEAVALDPTFIFGWTQLAIVQASVYDFNIDRSEAQLAKAKAAIDTAIRLAPEDPAVIRALGEFYYRTYRDYPRAVGQFQKLMALQPNDPNVYSSLSNVLHRQGRWADGLANMRKVLELDPGDFHLMRGIALALQRGRRYAEAIAAQRRLVELRPDDLSLAHHLAYLSFVASGSTREVEAFFAGLKAGEADSGPVLSSRLNWAAMQGNLAEAIRPEGRGRSWLGGAIVLAAQGNQAAARARLEKPAADLRAQLVQEPANDALWGRLGQMEAILGHPEEALRCARKAVELVPESLHAVVGANHRKSLAFVYAWTGDKDRAIAEYARLLRVAGSFLNVYEMRRHPEFFPLQGDPRFQALLNDPKNNAPLF